MTKYLLPAALLLATALTGLAQAQHAGSNVLAVADILPKKAGDGVCFVAALPRPATMAVEDWSDGKVKQEIVPGIFEKDGKPAMRPVPTVKPDEKLSAASLYITAEKLNPSEPFGFIAAAKLHGWKKTLYASGPCSYFDAAPSKPGASAANAKKFGCYVECDGGSIGIERVEGKTAILAFFDHAGGLRMTAGCGDEDSASFRLKATDGRLAIRFVPVPAKRCLALQNWLKRQ